MVTALDVRRVHAIPATSGGSGPRSTNRPTSCSRRGSVGSSTAARVISSSAISRGSSRELRVGHRPAAADVVAARDRIARLRSAWLALPRLRRRNTCYVRALTLYRFLDAGGRDVGLHVGIERHQTDRLRGHAWITVDGQMLEGPPEVEAGSIVEVNLGGR